jgi:hypothetical protein
MGSQSELGGALTLIPTQVSCMLKGLSNKQKYPHMSRQSELGGALTLIPTQVSCMLKGLEISTNSTNWQ